MPRFCSAVSITGNAGFSNPASSTLIRCGIGPSSSPKSRHVPFTGLRRSDIDTSSTSHADSTLCVRYASGDNPNDRILGSPSSTTGGSSPAHAPGNARCAYNANANASSESDNTRCHPFKKNDAGNPNAASTAVGTSYGTRDAPDRPDSTKILKDSYFILGR